MFTVPLMFNINNKEGKHYIPLAMSIVCEWWEGENITVPLVFDMTNVKGEKFTVPLRLDTVH